MSGTNDLNERNPDFSVYVFGNRACFTTSFTGDRVFWAPDLSNGQTKEYSPFFTPSTAIKGAARFAGGVTGLEFRFTQPRLYSDQMPMWAVTGIRRVHDNEVVNANQKKSNMLGMAMNGPFSWMARMLKAAGAKRVYGVRSPKVLLWWSASDLASYCDKICLACRNETLPYPFDDDNDVFDDDDDD
jgi:hypothetical protein